VAKKRGQNEGSIYQMKDGRWRAAVSLGWQKNDAGEVIWKRRVLTADTRGAVQEQLTHVLAQQQLGLPIAPVRTTVEGFLHDWLETVAKPGVRPKTYRTYADLIRLHIVPEIGALPLAKLTPQDVRTLLNNKLNRLQPSRSKVEGAESRPLSPRTVKHILVTLRTALETAVKDGIIPRNVAAVVDPPRSARKEPQTFTPEQARAFLDAVSGDRLEALFTVAASIGMRQGEILGLRLQDIDLAAGSLSVRCALQRVEKKLQQVSGNRAISLPSVAVSALAAHLMRREDERRWAGSDWNETGYLFTTKNGTPIDARHVIRRFHAILKTTAGLPRLRFHDLRHSTATLLLAQGVSLDI
jgi:integrase